MLRLSPGFVAALLLVVCGHAHQATAARILSMHWPQARSHLHQVTKVARELARRGHDVHYVVTTADLDKGDFTGLTVHAVDIGLTYEQHVAKYMKSCDMNTLEGMEYIAKLHAWTCEKYLESESLIEELKQYRFDHAFAGLGGMCVEGLKQLVGIENPTTWLSPIGFVEPWVSIALGNTFVPETLLPVWGGPYVQKDLAELKPRVVNSVYFEKTKELIKKHYIDSFNEIFMHHGLQPNFANPELPQGIVILPSVIGLHPPSALPTNYKLVGPLTPRPAEALQGDVEHFVQGAGGIIVVSLGTWTRLPLAQTRELSVALSRLEPKIKVLWKTNTSDAAYQEAITGHDEFSADKFFLSSWLPLNDLLGHRKTVAAVMHGGYNSLMEAAYHGVAVVVTPMMGDQTFNAALLGQHGLSFVVKKDDIDADKLSTALDGAMQHDRAVSQRIARLVRETTPLKDSADAVEYAIRTDGAAHLDFALPRTLDWYGRNGVDAALALLWHKHKIPIVAVLLWLLGSSIYTLVALAKAFVARRKRIAKKRKAAKVQ
eukprot:m.480097 g.480097  ORF g.480097 m.480097 type:complete len:544 (+) comp21698_c0_seq1:129-1760(+)